MHKEKEETQETAFNAVKEIISWDSPNNMRDNLRQMLDTFFLYYECPTNEFKHSMWATWHELDAFLKKLVPLEETIRNINSEQIKKELGL
jgi:hypothetical protein